jgi:DNA topoisomerase-3
VYKIIALQYIAQFYPSLKYQQTNGVVSCGNYAFNFSGKAVRSLGWKELFARQSANNDNSEDNNEEEQALPVMTINQAVTHNAHQIKQSTTTKPKPYTEGTLIKAMANIHNELENIVKSYYSDTAKAQEIASKYKKVLKETAGLGTEATRSGIIKTLKTREFITLAGKNIQVTDKGKQFMQLLTNPQHLLNFSMLTSPLTTAMYEQQLDDLLNHKFTAEKFYANLDVLLNDKLALIKGMYGTITPTQANKPPAKATGKQCPECGANIVERQGKFGKFEACSGYPKCKWMPPKPKLDMEPTGKTCQKCTADLVKRKSKAGRIFLACSNYPKCSYVEFL